MQRKDVTFASGLMSPIHRWFRLTPSFGPELVRTMLTALSAQKSDLILDPFAGASTTLIEAKLMGYNSIGFEINPFLHFVGETSLNWRCDPNVVSKDLERISREFLQCKRTISHAALEATGVYVPPIYNPTRWWRPDVLLELLLLKRTISELVTDETVTKLFRLALAGALVPELTNVTLGRLQLHFIDRSHDHIDVLGTFQRRVTEIVEDLRLVQLSKARSEARLFQQDSTSLNGFKPSQPISVVVTSPPYPNRYSYVWNTRPHLYFFDFFATAKEASQLDVLTIGGTWGTATSMLAKGTVAPTCPAVDDLISPIAAAIRQTGDVLMANYLMRYFNLLGQQLLSLKPHLSTDARLAYVVGCSRLKGVYVETDVLLGALAEKLGMGLKISRIERIRKRNSGADLHESIVYLERG
jgi:hypothetical protein